MATEPFNYESEELATLIAARRYQEWIAEQFRPYIRGTVMEVGAGIGTMAQKWKAQAQRMLLIEPADNLYPLLKTQFADNPRVQVCHGTLDDVVSRADGPGAGSLDSVVMINVLEHIEQDEATLRKIYRLLAPQGYLMVFVPAMPSLYGSLDRHFGHFRRYTKSGLTDVCQRAGFKTVRQTYFDFLGALPWWFVNRVLCSKRMNPTLAGLYDRYVVPVGRWLEQRVPAPFGKNLLYVGRKPA